MTLYSELQALVAEFTRGTKPLGDLRSWLEDHADEVMESRGKRLTRLEGLAWTLIGELDRDDRDEGSVRAELEAALRSLRKQVSQRDLTRICHSVGEP